MYTVLKATHLTCVLLTYALFFVRGLWLLRAPQRLSQTWARVVPHTVDTILLASAIGLVVVTGQYPGEQAWLTAKIVAVVLYIVLGILSFRVCRSRTGQVTAWIMAQVVFVYIVTVALTRSSFLM